MAHDDTHDDAAPDGATEAEASRPSRRALLKKAVVGATAAGVVWSAPRIEGLTVRPDYAAAASVPGGTPSAANVTLRFNSYTSPLKFSASGFGQISLAFVNVKGSWINPSQIQINEMTYDGAVPVSFTGSDINPALTNVAPGSGPISTVALPIVASGADIGVNYAWRLGFRCA